MVATIQNILDFFYPMFKRFFDKTTYRYAACGGANTVFDILLFFIGYNFIFKKFIIIQDKLSFEQIENLDYKNIQNNIYIVAKY